MDFTGGLTFTGGLSVTASAAEANDTYFMYNTLLLPGNGTNLAQNNTFLDGSTNNFSITRNGNTTQGTYSPYGPNWSNYFGGASNYITVPYSAALAFGTGDFCVEFWLYWTGGANENNVIMNNASGGFNLKLSATNPANWALENSYVGQVADFGTAPTKNAWHHIAVTRSSGTLYAFIDGTQVFSGANSTNFTNTNTWYIGANGYSVSTYYIIGNLSNLRIVVGSAVYTSNFTPPTSPLTAIANTSLLTCQSNRFIDNSTNNFTITSIASTVQRYSPFSPTQAYDTSTIGGSGYFDGSGDSLQVSSGSSISGTGDFTAECWIYPTAVPSTYNVIGCSDTTGGLTMFGLNANGTIFMGRSLIDVQATTTNSLSYNTWNHIAVSRSSGTVRLFINGVQGYSGSITTNYNAGVVRLGTDGGGSALPYTGYISNFRIITNSAIYTSNFTPSTTPLTAVANTSLLLNYTNAGIIDNTMINNLETVGNAQISTTQSKFGGSSMNFDGTGDYLTTPFSPLTQFGTGDFTIEFWLYRAGGSIYQTILDTRSSGTASPWAVLLNSSNQPYILIASDITSSIAVASATWTHIAICRASGTLRIFNDGVVGYSGANSTSMMPTGPLRIGKTIDDVYDLNGYIDDLRITKGYARYTTTFTPPTAAFPLY